MIDACRLTRATVIVTPHNDVVAVARALAGRGQRRGAGARGDQDPVLGDAAPLAELAERVAAEGRGADRGRGARVGVGRARRPRPAGGAWPGRAAPTWWRAGTLSKSFGSQGGLALGSAAVREHLVNRARPFIYDTGLALCRGRRARRAAR